MKAKLERELEAELEGTADMPVCDCPWRREGKGYISDE